MLVLTYEKSKMEKKVMNMIWVLYAHLGLHFHCIYICICDAGEFICLAGEREKDCLGGRLPPNVSKLEVVGDKRKIVTFK